MTQATGRHVSLAFITGVRRWALPLLRLLFAVARRVPAITAPLRRMKSIHAARWTIIDRWPGPDGAPVDPLLLFESDFDGDLELYIDGFAEVRPLHLLMWSSWSSSFGFPGIVPTARFDRWVRSHETTPGHLYSAFPDLAMSTIDNAVRLDSAFDDFCVSSRRLGDDALVAAWPAFLRKVQAWL